MKKILILITDMSCGGVQVSLLNFLNHILKYDVDITLLFDSYSGDWLDRLPQNIKIRTMPYRCDAHHKLLIPDKKVSFAQNVRYHVLVHLVDQILPHRHERNKRYTFLLKHMDALEDSYDIAIDYHGYGYFTTAYLVNKVHAEYKAVFVHDEKLDCLWAVKDDLDGVDAFYSVSRSCKKIFEQKYPNYAKKSYYFPNFMDYDNILKKANLPCPLTENAGEMTIVTVGRLEWQKGYDLAVNIAEKLSENQVPFVWYCLGDGTLKNEIQNKIDKAELHDKMILVGRTDNPYPYMKKADLYVQPSRHEGFGLAVAEALFLKKIVVATNLECIAEQIENGENGILVPYEVQAFYQAIMECINNEGLREKLTRKIEMTSERNSDFYLERLLEN
ncbi:MAG TPA: glycosyltransferase [Candidatus Mediterraneibacter faecavium]|uniref:Glycosyltransferase n=1 Tax=Candidatus Mediterraneibacter faecavium TaxID=2838668 RepID=A0A9D2QB87_9FIRM|nr:glycosyltransferase [Candidatus Mediterraneibacter faecavium]